MANEIRDEFPLGIKKILQERVGNRCSQCGCSTTGPNTEQGKATRIGVAAHITAAAKGGPRYDETLTAEERKSIQNGIWLCQNCARLIDVDVLRYTVEVINKWKLDAEELARKELERKETASNHDVLQHQIDVINQSKLQAEESAKRELEGKETALNHDEVGYSCPYCDTFVKLGKVVCVGCHAEIVYGSTKYEWGKNFKIGKLFGFFLGALIFIFLPDLLSKWLSINVPTLFGINFYIAVAINIAASFCMGYFNAKIFDHQRKRSLPRFFRTMNT